MCYSIFRGMFVVMWLGTCWQLAPHYFVYKMLEVYLHIVVYGKYVVYLHIVVYNLLVIFRQLVVPKLVAFKWGSKLVTGMLDKQLAMKKLSVCISLGCNMYVIQVIRYLCA